MKPYVDDLETRRIRGDAYQARALVDRLEHSPTASPAEIRQARKVAYLTIRRARALGVVVPSWRRRNAVRSSVMSARCSVCGAPISDHPLHDDCALIDEGRLDRDDDGGTPYGRLGAAWARQNRDRP